MGELYTLNKEQAEFVHELCRRGYTYRATANACLASDLFKEYHDEIIPEGSYDGCHLKFAADVYYGYEKGTHDGMSGEYWKEARRTPIGRICTARLRKVRVEYKEASDAAERKEISKTVRAFHDEIAKVKHLEGADLLEVLKDIEVRHGLTEYMPDS